MVRNHATAMGITLIFLSAVATASENQNHEHLHESHPRCPDPGTPADVIRCLTSSHNLIQISLKGLKATEEGTSASRQWSNPELQVQGMKNPRGSSYQVQSTLIFEPPFLGTRIARIHAATSESERSRAMHELLQSTIKVDGILKLTRLRQILREIQINRLSQEALTRALSAIHLRGRLTPEMETSESIFGLASHATTLENSFLADEKQEIGHFFEVHTGYTFSQLEKALPPEYEVWPILEKNIPYRADSPKARILEAELKLSQAGLDAERAKTFSAFRLGPMFQTELKDNTDRETLLGFQFDIPIPLFNLNGEGTSRAGSELVRSEIALQLGNAEEEHERLEQLECYNRAINIMKSLPSQSNLDGLIKRGISQHQRGLINASQLMELFRQGMEYLRSRHQRERQALASLWKVYFIENRTNEEMK